MKGSHRALLSSTISTSDELRLTTRRAPVFVGCKRDARTPSLSIETTIWPSITTLSSMDFSHRITAGACLSSETEGQGCHLVHLGRCLNEPANFVGERALLLTYWLLDRRGRRGLGGNPLPPNGLLERAVCWFRIDDPPAPDFRRQATQRSMSDTSATSRQPRAAQPPSLLPPTDPRTHAPKNLRHIWRFRNLRSACDSRRWQGAKQLRSSTSTLERRWNEVHAGDQQNHPDVPQLPETVNIEESAPRQHASDRARYCRIQRGRSAVAG